MSSAGGGGGGGGGGQRPWKGKPDFAAYLRDSGILDLISKAMVKIYELTEAPADAGAVLAWALGHTATFERQEMEIKRLREENEQLRASNRELLAARNFYRRLL